MTQQITFRRPMDVASKGQLQSAKRLIKSKDSQGLEAVRKTIIGDQAEADYPTGFVEANFPNGVETFIVVSKQTYIITKDTEENFECNTIDQDGTQGQLCLGFKNCSFKPNPRQEKICKHIVAVDMVFGN